MRLQYSIILLLSCCFLNKMHEATSQEDTWFDPSVWEDLGSGTYIDEDIWNDPDLVDWKTCSKVFDELENDQDHDELHMDVLDLAGTDVHRSGVAQQKLWPRSVIPTRLEPGMSINEQKRLACAVMFFTENTCVRFVKHKASDVNYLTIKKTDSRSGCFSESLGMITGEGEQIVNLDERSRHCWLHGTIIHELMHAIGFFHEQARNDRDAFIQVHWNDIEPHWQKQFKKGAEVGVTQQLVGSYDYNSVMHYRRFIRSKAVMTALEAPVDKNNQAMGNRKAPTAMDMQKINELYKCNDFDRDCMVSEWQSVGPCQDGKQNIKRSILQNVTGNGTQCPELTGVLKCKEQTCYDGCQLEQWSVWTACTKLCGGGQMSRTHKVTCPDVHETMTCSTNPCDSADASQVMLLIGGQGSNSSSSIELYYPNNPQLNTVINSSLLQPRSHHASVSINQTALIMGGHHPPDQYLGLCERFSIASHQSTRFDRPIQGRASAAAAVLDNVPYLCGGYASNQPRAVNSCEKYGSNGWEFIRPMSERRTQFAMVELNGLLYAIGGYEPSPRPGLDPIDTILGSVEKYSPTTGLWSTRMPPLKTARFSHAAAALDGWIYVCGGSDTRRAVLKGCEKLKPEEHRWRTGIEMMRPRSYFNMVAVLDGLFVFGGMHDGHRVEKYEPGKEEWTRKKSLIYERKLSTAVVIEL